MKDEAVICPICGREDNSDGRRGGLCIQCFCRKVIDHMFDITKDRRHPTLQEIAEYDSGKIRNV